MDADELRRSKSRERSARYRAKHPGRVRELARDGARRRYAEKKLADPDWRQMTWRERDPEGYKAYLKEYREKNKDRLRAVGRERYQRDKAKRQFAQKKHKYGLTQEQYDAMIGAQGNRCAICGGPPNGRWPTLHIDHCHETGLVRELLCDRCNQGIARFQDDPELLHEAAAYLERHAATRAA